MLELMSAVIDSGVLLQQAGGGGGLSVSSAKALAAGLAALGVGFAGIGTGVAQRGIGAASVGAYSEGSISLGIAVFLTVIPETIIIIAFVTIFLVG